MKSLSSIVLMAIIFCGFHAQGVEAQTPIQDYIPPNNNGVGHDLLDRQGQVIMPLFGTLRCEVLISFLSDEGPVDPKFSDILERTIPQIRHVRFWCRSWGDQGNVAYCGYGPYSDVVLGISLFTDQIRKHPPPETGEFRVQPKW